MTNFLKIPVKYLSKHFANISLDVPYEAKAYAVAPRDVEQYKEAYKNFDNMFGIFLSKFSDSYPIKQVVKIPYNQKIILFGVSTDQSKDKLFVRCAIDDENRLFGIILDATKLGIDLQTGETLHIDNCIYATYYGMIRAAIITQQKHVKDDHELNQKLSNYLYLLFLKAIGSKQFLSREKQTMLQIACIFLYYKHYYGLKDSAVYNLVSKNYTQLIDPEKVKAFYTKYKNTLSKFTHIRQLPQLLFDITVLKTHPNQVLLNMFKLYGLDAFTSIMFSLDTLAALCVVSKYSASDLFSSSCVVSSKLQSVVEEDVLKLIKKVKIVKSKYTKG